MPQRQGFQNATTLTVGLCVTYNLCIAGVRIWIRRGAFGADDLVIAIATIITLCNSVASFIAVSQGLGDPWSSIEVAGSVPGLNEASIAGIVTFITALYLSKCAMLSFLSRITKTPWQIKLFVTCNVVTALIGLASVLITTVGCPTDSGYYWAFHANRTSCPSQNMRWQVFTALDILTEILLLALPVHLVWGLQMPLRKKAMILIAFYLRLPVLGFSIGRNYYTMQLRLPQTDPGLESALVVIWLEVELAFALAASTLSALKIFTESFNSCFGLGFTRGKGEGSYGMSNVSGSSGGQSNKTSEKTTTTKASSAFGSSAGGSRMGSIGPASPDAPAKGDVEILVSPLTPTAETVEEYPHPQECSGALRLRPETELKSFTRVSANPNHPVFGVEHPAWRENSSASSESSGPDDLVILRETGYEVQHDQAPMLGRECLGV